MFRLQLRSFYKNIWLSLIMGILILGAFIYPMRYYPIVTSQYTRDIWVFMKVSQETVIVCFTVFLFLSYEYFSQLRQNGMMESLSGIPGGMRSYYLSRAGVMLLFDGVLTLGLILLTVIGYFIVPLEPAVLFHIILSVFLNFFCNCLIAILIGMALSLMRQRLFSYFCIVFLVLFGSQLADQVLGGLATDGIVNLYEVYRFFNFYPPNYTFAPNQHIGTSLLPWRWMLLGFWACLSLAFVAAALWKGKGNKRWGRGACALLCVLALGFGSGVVLHGSTIAFDRNPKGTGIEEQQYYQDRSLKQRQKAADFEVTGYQLKLKIRNALKATAALELRPSRLPEYSFTLYHTFGVKEVKAQSGELLPFSQEGDYITVKNPTEREIRSLTFTYGGYSPAYYSNMQGVYLPGSFPYYPQAGFLKMTDDNVYSFNARPVPLSKAVPFTVSVNAPYKVVSNLTQSEPGVFHGNTNGVTLMSGFLKQVTLNGVPAICPSSFSEETLGYLEEDMKLMDQVYEQAKAQNPNAPGWRRKIVFLVPSVNQRSDIIWMTDHIVFDSVGADQYAGVLQAQGYKIQVEGVKPID